MRVAIITEGYFPELSGVTTSLHERLKWLSRWGHQAQVYAPDYAPLAAMYPHYRQHVGEVMKGITVRPFPSVPYHVPYTRDPKPFSFGRVARQIAAFRPQILHVECPERLFMGFYTRPGVALARQLGVPATAMYHTNYLGLIEDYKRTIPWLRLPLVERLLKQVMVWVYNSYAITMTPSHITENFLRQNGVKNTRLGAFHGVAAEAFHPKTCNQVPGSPPAYQKLEEGVKVLYAGRITPDKQIGLILEAFERVQAQGTKANFILVGSGIEEERVRTWVGERRDRVWISRQPYADMPMYYQGADLLGIACAVESGPLVAWEAMACGLPVVGPAAGGASEIIHHEQTGLYFRPHDAGDMAAALTRLITDHSLRRQLGANAIVAARQRTWENSAHAMVEYWEECIRMKGSSGRPPGG